MSIFNPGAGYGSGIPDLSRKEAIMTIKFIHLRRRHPLFGNLEPCGGVTVAYEVQDGHVTYTYSVCSPKDHYTKSIGRAVATGRLQAPHVPNAGFPYVEGVNVVEQIINHHDKGGAA
jgi:hypothetical protein